ncbi:DUF4783 domain-containing protein [Parasegetibacter sp. NRK P23]|uniref:DUF4783 domain-containing protein n=1 Tax=Parasegetibacter sp. NRK P23 TaxID=2942999 RepID=UPI0020433346|nr:DUF4783 domain-containing protein [Parasegetibacter sp. NRK P23]MCM5527533.1 DUF4783 domain-containing protein [Parasegetibacter sp. NRK P23]
MKYLYRSALILLPVLLLTAFTNFQTLDGVVSAMKSGNAAQLSKFFDTYVDISLPAKSNSYSKSQAELVMKDFFTTNAVKSFEVKHKGENGGSQFCIGILQTKNGQYRATIFLKQKGEKQLLQEIRLENSGA